MRYLFGILIFPSDGTSRIRFTGQSQQAHSQPDTSGPPKTYLLGVGDSIPKLSENVKVFVIERAKRVEGSFPFQPTILNGSFDSAAHISMYDCHRQSLH